VSAQKIKATFVEPMHLLSPEGADGAPDETVIDGEVIALDEFGRPHSTQTSDTFGEIIEHFGTWTSKEQSIGERT